MRVSVRLGLIVGTSLVGYFARGFQPKFKNWTLRFELVREAMRVLMQLPRGDTVIDDIQARAVRLQSAALGTALGWFACRWYARRIKPVHANGVDLLWLRPTIRKEDSKRIVVLYVHGDRFEVMSPRLYLAFSMNLAVTLEKELNHDAQSVQVDVFIANYRTSPEDCSQAPADDTVVAFNYLLDTEDILPEHIILAGDSVGGGVVLSTLLRMRDSSLQLRLPLAAILICPAINLSEFQHLCDSNEPETEDPSASTLVLSGLRGLPPVLVQAASLDYLYQYCVRLAQQVEADSVTNWEFDVHEGLPHVFSIFPSYILPYAQVGVQNMAAFAAKHFTNALVACSKSDIVTVTAHSNPYSNPDRREEAR